MAVIYSTPQAASTPSSEPDVVLEAANAGFGVVGSRLLLPILHHVSTGSSVAEVDLASLFLPPSPLRSAPTAWLEKPGLLDVLLASVVQHAGRLSDAKSKHIHCRATFLTTVKFVEYGWLNNCYSLAEWTPQLAEKLLDELAAGGWSHALRIAERADAFCAQLSVDEARSLLYSNSNGEMGTSIRGRFRCAIGTAMSTKGLRAALPYLLAAANPRAHGLNAKLEEPVLPAPTRRISAATLSSELRAINSLCDLSRSGGLGFLPYPQPRKIAEAIGGKGGRTSNLGPTEVCKLLVEAHQWVNVYADRILELISEIHAAQKQEQSSQQDRVKVWNRVLEKSALRVHLEKLVGCRITSLFQRSGRLEEDEFSLMALVYTLTTACFVTVNYFNGRRKDEVQHPVIGLKRKSLKLVDAALGLYQCDFYIEKSLKGEIPYYVGVPTVQAIKVLARSSALAWKMLALTRGRPGGLPNSDEDSLFVMPRLQPDTGTRRPMRFTFDACRRTGPSRRFVARALGKDSEVEIRSHMGRRAYALMFLYRYENADIVALQQQFGHLTLDPIFTYLTEGPQNKSTNRSGAELWSRLTPEQRQAQQDDLKELELEVRVVGRERLEQIALEVIGKVARYSGGFTTLIDRFHRKISRRLDFRELASDKQAKQVAQALDEAGHEFVPYPHGTCAASRTKPNRGAACWSKEHRAFRREKASAKVCGPCAFHLVSPGHLASLDRQVIWMKAEQVRLGTETVAGKHAGVEVANLQASINLHSTRMFGEGYDGEAR